MLRRTAFIDGISFELSDPPSRVYVNILNMDLDTPQTLETLKKVKQHHEGLIAVAQLVEIDNQIEAGITLYEKHKDFGFKFPMQVQNYTSPEMQARIKHWISLANDQPIVDMEDLDYYKARLGAARRLVDAVEEYERQVALARKFPQAHCGYVYLFKLSTGHYKIGLSAKPERRGREIVSGLPLTLDLLHQIPSNQVTCLERELHKKYAFKRYRKTEWFHLSDADVLDIKAITERNYAWVDNPEWEKTARPTLEQFEFR